MYCQCPISQYRAVGLLQFPCATPGSTSCKFELDHCSYRCGSERPHLLPWLSRNFSLKCGLLALTCYPGLPVTLALQEPLPEVQLVGPHLKSSLKCGLLALTCYAGSPVTLALQEVLPEV
eukprot:1158721-Pelagomonas_calceolata.AAC.6